MQQATIDDFQKIEIRVGKILAVELLPNPKYTTHKLTIDFGPEIGQRISGARAIRYSKEELIGKYILGVVNFPPRQIGKLMSQSLTLGVPGADGECILVTPDKEGVVLGGKLY
jgi:tRNA-binding protein